MPELSQAVVLPFIHSAGYGSFYSAKMRQRNVKGLGNQPSLRIEKNRRQTFEYDILSLIQGLVSCEIWQIGECI